MRFPVLAVIYLAFVSLGLPDTVLGVAWPPMRADLSLELEVAGVLAVVTTLGTALSSFGYGWLVARLGSRTIVVLSVLLTAAALLGYGISGSLGALLIFAIPLGLGAGAVDTGLNSYVARYYSSQHMNWLHASWGVGAFLGPTIMSFSIADPGWRYGFFFIALIQVLIALLLALGLPLGGDEGKEAAASPTEPDPSPGAPGAVRLSLLSFLSYSTVEMGVGLWLASYLIEGRGWESVWAGSLAAMFFLCIAVGRFVVGFIANHLPSRVLIRAGSLVLTIGGFILLLGPHRMTGPAVLLLGLGCAPIFPSMVHETPRLFGRSQAETITGYQVGTYYLAGVTLVPAFGLVAQNVSLEAIPVSIAVFAVTILWATESMYRRLALPGRTG